MRRGLRFYVAFSTMVFCLKALVTSSFAQNASSPPPNPRYSFALIGMPLNQALFTLIEQTGIELFYESGLVAGKATFCRIDEASEEDALACILDSTQLDYIRQSTGLYVVVPASRTAPLFGSILGQVVDTETGEPLPQASIVLLDDKTGTATNVDGHFAFDRLLPGMHRFSVSHVAYESLLDSVRISPLESQLLSIKLQRRTILAMPIVIEELSHRRWDLSLDQQIDSATLREAGAAPTPNTLDALNTVVGVHVGDALSDVHVQGGDSGEHQYLLDGAPVFVPLRSVGFFGSFSPYALEQITVHKAGFEARYGSFLSGTIDMTHDVVPDNSSIATLQIDPLSLNGRIHAVLDAPKQMQISLMAAGRLGLWDVFQPSQIGRSMRSWSAPNAYIYEALLQTTHSEADTLMLDEGSLPSFNFSDLHAAARIRFSRARSLYLSMYHGRNRFALDVAANTNPQSEFSEEAYSWRNRTRQVRYEWIQGRRAFLSAAMWQSDFRLRHPLDLDPFSILKPSPEPSDTSNVEDFNEILETGLKFEFDLYASNRHVISGGVSTTYTETEFFLSIDPFGKTPAIDDNNIHPARWLANSFVQDAFSLSEQTKLTAGSRFTYVFGQERLYAEPRIGIDHENVRGKWMFHAGAGLYRQFIDQFDVASYNLTALLPVFRFWIPISRDRRAPVAYHFAGSVLFTPDPALKVNLETYYKHQPRLTSLDFRMRLESPDSSTSNGLIDARGYAYGAGISIDYNRSAFHLQGRYDYAVARRKIADRFGGLHVAAPWQTPHQIHAAFDFTPWKSWTATVRWQGKWGRRWGFRQAYYDYLEPDPRLRQLSNFDFSDPESHRLPAFKQLDLGIAYNRRIGRTHVQARLSFLNVFDKKNTVEWILENSKELDKAVLKTREGPPFYPSASLRIRL